MVANLDARMGLGRLGLSAQVRGSAGGQTSSARQSWDNETISKKRNPRFDIAPRTGFFTEDGSRWVESYGRPADIFFPWHGERRREFAGHRDTNRWQFFIVAEQDLPENQKSIGLPGLEAIVSPCRIKDLKSAVENACPARRALKAALEHIQKCM